MPNTLADVEKQRLHASDQSSVCNRSAVFDGYISEAEYARQRGVSLRTAQRDRALRRAPPHVIIGRQVFYRIEAVRTWLLKQERTYGRR